MVERSLSGAAFLAKSGFRLVEIHKVNRAEANFQFIFTERKERGAKIADFSINSKPSSVIIADAMRELVRVLSEGFSTTVSFRFSDVTVLNCKKPYDS